MHSRFVLLVVLYSLVFLSAQAQQKKITLLPVVENGKWGFINKEGKIIVPPQYDQAGEFNGYVSTTMLDGLVYVIDSTGKLLFQQGYQDIELLQDGWIALRQDKYALADATGKIHTSFSYQQILHKGLNTISLRLDTLQYEIFNARTRVKSETIYSDVKVPEQELFLQVKKGDQVALLDSLHAVRMPLNKGVSARIINGVPVLNTGNGFLFFKSNGMVSNDSCTWKEYEVYSPYFVEVWNIASQKFILTVENGKLTPFTTFISADPFTDELLKLNKDNKVGLLDKHGTVLLPGFYTEIEKRPDGLIFIRKEDKNGLLTSEGKILFPPQFDFIEKFDSNGIALASVQNLRGLVHKNGKTLVPFRYMHIEIHADSWKCYTASGSMDQYLLLNPTTVDEILNFKNVGTVNVGPKYTGGSNYGFTKRPALVPQRGVYRKSKSGNYLLTYRLERYDTKSKLKCLIPKNFLNVERLFGAYSVPERLTLASKEYWDIQIEEFDYQECARIILPGDRQGLLTKTGSIKTTLPALKNGRYLPQTITYIGPFINGLARVNVGGTFVVGEDIKEPGRETFSRHNLSCNGGKWGYINGKGEVVIKIDLDYVSDFCNGKAIIRKEGKYGVIDSLNQTIIKPQYSFIEYLEKSDNRFFKLYRYRNEWGLVSSSGKVIQKAEYDRVGLINNNRVPVSKGGRWGALNYKGELVIPCKFEQLNTFSEGKAFYKEKFRWGVVDSVGNVIKEPMFQEVYKYCEGLAAVRFENKWGFIDGKGNWAIPPQYSSVRNFEGGVTAVYLEKKWWFIDKSGKKFSSGTYTEVGTFDTNGLAIVRKKKKYMVLKRSDGNTLKHVEYAFIAPFSEGYARVKSKKKNRYGFIDTLGKLVVPMEYTNASGFHNGLARVRIGSGKWGYIRPDNSMAIAAQYSRCEDFSEQKATVIVDRKVSVIDLKGSVLFSLPETTLGKYSEDVLLIKGTYYSDNGRVIMKVMKGTEFKNGIANVTMVLDKRYQESLVNRKNIRVSTFDQISTPKDGIAAFMISRRLGLASAEGQIISDPLYQRMMYIGEGIFQVQLFDAVGYLRQNGEWIWKPGR